MFFSSIVIKVRVGCEVDNLMNKSQPLAHLILLQLLEDKQSTTVRLISQLQAERKMTIATVSGVDHTALVRITSLSREGLLLMGDLVNLFSLHMTLKPDEPFLVIESIETSNSEWTRLSTWADLLREKECNSIRFDFVTPTNLFTGSTVNGKIYPIALPEPDVVFGYLLDRWEDLGGPQLSWSVEQNMQESGCLVSAYESKTAEFDFPNGEKQIGLKGWIVYDCHKAPKILMKTINALARLAFFSGIGNYTAQGMGATRVKFLG